MVCLGNICRSPLAQGVLQHKLDSFNLKNIYVDSAGTGSWHAGNPPDIRSIEIAEKYGIDISQQRARQFSSNDFNTFNKIIVMDTKNYKDLLNLSSSQIDSDKIKLLLSYTYKNERASVPDPYYGGDDGFENIYKLINSACNEIIKEIIKDINE
jgi:protein-tyrosine phosphatase